MIAQIRQWWSELHPHTRSLFTHLWGALVSFNQHGTRQAAALAYYSIFSIFPLSLLLAVGVSALVGPAIASEQISNGLRLFLPEQTVALFQSNVQETLAQSSPFGLVAVVGLAWSALGLFSNLTHALDVIFDVPSSRSMWRQRLVAFLMTVMLIVLIIASFVTSGVMQLIYVFLGNNPNLWVAMGRLFLPLGLNMVIFALLFRYVPSRVVHWDAVWSAALFGGIGWELSKGAFAWYLQNLANFQFVYGSIATVIALLLYAYITASLFLLSAELCARLNVWFHEYPAPQWAE
jgi:membrane protein